MKKRVLTALVVLTGIFLLSASIVWAQPAPVARTGQTTCYADNNTLTYCTNPDAAGQDGDLQMGVPWPDPRFTDNGDGTVTDNLTGLMWTKDANDNGTMSWNDAIDYSNNLSLGNAGCGSNHTDWRLPNVNELQSLIDFGHELINSVDVKLPTGHPFVNVEVGPPYWSSTSKINEDNDTTSITARTMVMVFGLANSFRSKFQSYWVWPVRGETIGSQAPVAKTGQTYSYRTGDDGDLQAGADVQGERFNDHNDGTVTDRLTGLMWTKEATHEEEMTWNDVIDYANDLSYGGAGCGSGYNDWRLPNIREIQSLIDYSHFEPALTAGHPFIVNTGEPQYLWTSTTSMYTSLPSCYVIRIIDGYTYVHNKTRDYNELWLVRDGN
jgi:hypothetical protein